jgi:phosphopantothenoylcysteine decarboxylase/phosphopantothenate--cysteine ligase
VPRVIDRSWLKGRRIALGIGGGIAAYKACDLVRELRRAGAEVRVAITPAAREFITAMTMQALSGHPVLTDSFDPVQETSFGHLHLARWADAFVIAPATADLISRIRAGIANDVVTTPLLAFRGPVLLAPRLERSPMATSAPAASPSSRTWSMPSRSWAARARCSERRC